MGIAPLSLLPWHVTYFFSERLIAVEVRFCSHIIHQAHVFGIDALHLLFRSTLSDKTMINHQSGSHKLAREPEGIL